MPFCKRAIVPKHVSKSDRGDQGVIFADLVDVCSFTLCSVLKQLSDLSRQSVSILEDLEGELLSICQRSVILENKVINLQKHVSAFICKPPSNTPTNLELESKRTAHFQSSWQQNVNVFSSWSRPECVQELHQEAQLNLHRLLQDFEEQLYDSKVTGQTFRQLSSESSEDTSQSRSPVATGNKRPGLLFQPASKRDTGQTFTSWAPDSVNSRSAGRVPSRLRSSRAPPVAEKPQWHLRCHTPARPWPAEGTGERDRTLGLDLIEGTQSPEPLSPQDPTQSPRSRALHVPLRKTCSDLDQSVSRSPGRMDQASLMCTSSSWNGPKGSTFCPTWSSSFSSYVLSSNSVDKSPSPDHAAVVLPCPFQGGSGRSLSSGSHSSSFTSIPTNSSVKTQTTLPTDNTCRQSPSGRAGGSSGEKEEKSSNLSRKFHERSLSTPTDSDSLCSVDNASYGERRPEVDDYALRYPSGSSEEGANTDHILAADLLPDGGSRSRSRSISLKKPKKKPLPPLRSVSLRSSQADSEDHVKDGRPRSLILPRDHLADFQPEFLTSSALVQGVQGSPLSGGRSTAETQASIGKKAKSCYLPLNRYELTDTKTSVPKSNTARDTEPAETGKESSSSESLPSPSVCLSSTSPQLSVESEPKNPHIKPAGVLSPSSGYSSQSETPTPTVPTSAIVGPSPLGCRMRPKIPERKSSLPAVSAGEREARTRLSFELPLTMHLDLCSINPKAKASRRHSDSSTTDSSAQKLSPCQSMMPLVTQMDLRNVRLRSVSRSEADDGSDVSSGVIKEEVRSPAPCATPNPRTKPPVAVKPPLPKRPPNLTLKMPTSSSPITSQSLPASLAVQPSHAGNIYMVVKKPKAKKAAQSPLSPAAAQGRVEPQQQALGDQHVSEGCAQTFPPSSEPQDSRTALTSRPMLSPLAERDSKCNKVPPPVPKKPNVIFVPINSFHGSVPTDGQTQPAHSDSGSCQISDEKEGHVRHKECPGDCTQDPDKSAPVPQTSADESTMKLSEGMEPERMMMANIEDDCDDVFDHSSTPHSTEDLFTIIHRSKRRVLGRKEMQDQFGSKGSLVSPVKSVSESHTASPADTSHCALRNNNTFMALLQRKSSKANGGARVSAAELLKNTNPLARRVMEFSLAEHQQPATNPTPPQGP